VHRSTTARSKGPANQFAYTSQPQRLDRALDPRGVPDRARVVLGRTGSAAGGLIEGIGDCRQRRGMVPTTRTAIPQAPG